MTLRASMLVPLIYDAPNLRRVTYIVSTAFVSLYTSCSCPLPERRETRDRPRDLMACTALVLLDLTWREESRGCGQRTSVTGLEAAQRAISCFGNFSWNFEVKKKKKRKIPNDLSTELQSINFSIRFQDSSFLT